VTTEKKLKKNPQQPDALHPCQRPYALASSSYKKQMTQKKSSLSLSLSPSLQHNSEPTNISSKSLFQGHSFCGDGKAW
jgi:hypothetical protein